LDFAGIDSRLFDAHPITFEISEYDDLSYSKSSIMVKECGICPLFSTKKKDENVVIV
jgi:hypothetical protein